MPRQSDHPHIDPRLARRISSKEAQLDRYRPLPADTVRRLNEDLRVFLTYHSNAIEGNTLSLRETQLVIDHGMTVGGHPLREYLEASNHAVALDYLTTLIDMPGATAAPRWGRKRRVREWEPGVPWDGARPSLNCKSAESRRTGTA